MIVITGLADKTVASDAVHVGAQDYLVKSLLTIETLTRAIRYGIERVKLRQELTAREAQYRLLAENVTDMIARHGPDSAIRYVSPSCRALLGYEPQALIGHQVDEFLHPDDLPILNAVRDESRRTLNTYTISYRIRHQDGSYRWLESTGNVIRDPASGLVHETISVSRDITDRHEAEAYIRLLKNAIEQSNDAVVVMDVAAELEEAPIVFVNPAFTRLIGYSPEEVLGKPRRVLHDHFSDPTLSQSVQAALARAESARGEAVNQRPDGEEIAIEWSIAPIRDANGAITNYVYVQRDITDRHRAQRALEESEARFAMITETLPVGIVTTRVSDDITLYVNAVYCDLVGMPQGAAVGQPVVNYVYDPDERQKLLDDVRRQGFAPVRDVQISRTDGSLRWALVAIRAVTLNGVAARLSVLQDITALKALQRQQAFLAAIVDSAEEAIVGKTLDGEILSWNRGAEHLYGYRAEEVIGQSIEIIAPPGKFDEIPGMLKRLGQGETLERFETVRVTKAGQRVNVSLSLTPVLDEKGAIIGAASVATDITARKKNAEDLQEAERFARSTLDALSAHIAILDETGTILSVNQGWREFALENQAAGNESVGANYLTVCDEFADAGSDEARAFAAGLRAIVRRESRLFELEYPCHSPTEQRWFVARVTRFPSEGPVRIVVAHENITERK